MHPARRVAALYDIHGNLPALEAVLAEIVGLDVDEVVIGGDVVPGPMHEDVISRLLDLDRPTRFIRGNCEVAVLAEMTGTDPGPLPEQVREIIRWTAQQLPVRWRSAFESWPRTITLDLTELGRVLFCHGTPRDENAIFTRRTAEDRLLPLFEDLDVVLVVCGHTHMQFDRKVGEIRVVNAGSVGMPFGRTGADWLLLGPSVELRHTSYDLPQAAARIRRTSYPQAEEFVTRCLLSPPSEEQMLDAFSRVEVK